MNTFGRLVGATVERLVTWIVVPVTGVIPRLVESGVALAIFAVLWLAFGVAVATNPATLDDAWQSIAGWPLLVQGVVWLLFLPVMAGLWVWGTDWELLLRVVLIAALAGWSLLIFVPRRQQRLAAGHES